MRHVPLACLALIDASPLALSAPLVHVVPSPEELRNPSHAAGDVVTIMSGPCGMAHGMCRSRHLVLLVMLSLLCRALRHGTQHVVDFAASLL